MSLSQSDIFELFFIGLLLMGAVLYLSRFKQRVNEITFSSLFVFFLAVFYGVAPLFSYIFADATARVDYDLHTIFFSYLGIFLFALGIILAEKFILGTKYSRHISGRKEVEYIPIILSKVNEMSLVKIIVCTLLVWMVRIILINKYAIGGWGSLTIIALSRVPYHIIILQHVTDVLAIGLVSICAIKLTGSAFNNHRTLCLMILFVELAWAILHYRRHIFIIMFILISIAVFQNKRLRLRHLVISLFVGVLLLKFLFPLVWEVRHRYLENRFGQGCDRLIYPLRESLADLWSSDDSFRTTQSYKRNLTQRSMIIYFQRDIIQKQSLYNEIMYGRALYSSVEKCLPRFLWLAESKLFSLGGEQRVNIFYHLPLVDRSSTWITFGQADFHLLGTFIYGFFFGTILVCLMLICVSPTTTPLLSGCFFGVLMYIIGMVEQSPSFTFMLIRDSLLLLLLSITMNLIHTVVRRHSPDTC